MRYPGSKRALAARLAELLPKGARTYAEPFCGSAAVALLVAPRVQHVHLNDADPGIAALWAIVVSAPKELAQLIRTYTPSAADFYAFKADPGTDLLDRAWRKLVLHQISYSGLGARAGSPIGGREQRGKYLVDCRWNAERLSAWVHRAHAVLADKTTVTNASWERAQWQVDFVFVDPPYVGVGPSLYLHGSIDHAGLAAHIRSLHANWAVTYDNHPLVHELYAGCQLHPYSTGSKLTHERITDVLITPGPALIYESSLSATKGVTKCQ